MSAKPAILFLVFNRPQETERVMALIRQYAPARLYVAADGPRATKPDEAEACNQTRQIATKTDWPCQLQTLFRDSNLGCRNAVSQAITWFFENEEEGIILEDDCLVNPDFFGFAAAMLEKYRDNTQVMHIGAGNFQDGIQRGEGSYYFSQFVHIWGWASWRRVWQGYSAGMESFYTLPAEVKNHLFWNPFVNSFYLKDFKSTADGLIDTWDYQYVYHIRKNAGLAIIPNVNMVSNIGFGQNATHTTSGSKLANMPTFGMPQIVHPKEVRQNQQADWYTMTNVYKAPRLYRWVKKLRKLINL